VESQEPDETVCGRQQHERQQALSLQHPGTQAVGDTSGGTLDSFKKFVRQKTNQIRKEYGCKAVEYSVEMQGGQVRLKAKPKT